jgi:prevent-host-death family protein
MEVNIHHAKTNLSKLILRVEAGEEVIIARAGKPVVRLVPAETPPRKVFKPGALKGRLKVPADFLAPDPAADREMEQLFYQNPLLTAERTRPAQRRPKKRKP